MEFITSMVVVLITTSLYFTYRKSQRSKKEITDHKDHWEKKRLKDKLKEFKSAWPQNRDKLGEVLGEHDSAFREEVLSFLLAQGKEVPLSFWMEHLGLLELCRKDYLGAYLKRHFVPQMLPLLEENAHSPRVSAWLKSRSHIEVGGDISLMDEEQGGLSRE
jgi:hypothetical protein